MSQRIVLNLGLGDLHSGFPAVNACLWEGDDPHPMKFTGSLPTAPQIPDLYRSWRLLYTALCHRLRSPRIQVDVADVTNVSEVEHHELCQKLAQTINHWLNSEPFKNIDQQLRTRLNATDEIRVLIETDDPLLRRLPWHLWNFFEDYPNAEVALSTQEYQRSPASRFQSPNSRVKILAILGNSEGINLHQDRLFLEQLSNQAEIEFLVEPSREQLNERLWEGCDILFFAGHSSSQPPEEWGKGETGYLLLNQRDRLTIPQLKYALRRAIDRGLKLAIFNSCDGLGLAHHLADLDIPQVIVMREPVPDGVAQVFLKYFLAAFVSGQSLYTAVREGRERLQGMEKQYPCASWLPVICQNPAIAPVSWQSLQPKQDEPAIVQSSKPAQRSRKNYFRTALLTSVAVTALVMGVRWLGWLQAWELKAFDHLMQQRPAEPQDPRLLIVGITEEDFQLPEQQYRKGSLSDLALLKLLQKLNQYQPRAIGLDIYRDFPVDSKLPGLANQIGSQDNFFVICKGQDQAASHPGIASPPEISVNRQGYSDVVTDPDNVLRRYLIAMEQEPNSPCTAPYSLSTQLAFHYLSVEGITAQFHPDLTLQVGDVIFHRLQNRSGGYQTIDTWGYQTLLNYRSYRSPTQIAPVVSLTDVLRDSIKPELVRDRIILIGVTAMGARDFVSTPYSLQTGQYQPMPGVIAQAQMISQILSTVKDKRPLLIPWTLWQEVIWLWLWAMSGGLMIGCMLLYQLPVKPLLFSLVLSTTVSLGSLYLLCLWFLIQGSWAPLVPSSLVLIATVGSMSVYAIRNQKQ